MYRTNHHLITLDTDEGEVQVEFGIIWKIQGSSWELDEIFVDCYEPEVYSMSRMKEILLEHVEEYCYNPCTPYEGENDEAFDHAD